MSKKKENSKKKKVKILIVLLVVLSLLTAVCYIVPSVINRQRSNGLSSGDERPMNVQSGETENESENLLMQVDSGEINNIFTLGRNAALVTSNSLISVKQSGKISDITKVGYANPVVKTAGDKYMVFERSTGKFAIMNKRGILYQSQLDERIINCDIASNGNYAIISEKTLSVSLVTLYSNKNRVLFQWECSDEYLTDIALSSNGKSLALAGLFVKNSESGSKVMYFKSNSTGVEKTFEFDESVIYKVKFLRGNNIGLVTDKEYVTVNIDKDEIKTASFDYDTVDGYQFNENMNTAILKTQFGSLNEHSVVVFDRNCNQIFETGVEGEVIDFKLDKNQLYVLTSGGVMIYQLSSGDLIKTVETPAGIKKISVFSKCIICADEKSVYKFEK